MTDEHCQTKVILFGKNHIFSCSSVWSKVVSAKGILFVLEEGDTLKTSCPVPLSGIRGTLTAHPCMRENAGKMLSSINGG